MYFLLELLLLTLFMLSALLFQLLLLLEVADVSAVISAAGADCPFPVADDDVTAVVFAARTALSVAGAAIKAVLSVSRGAACTCLLQKVLCFCFKSCY